MKNYKVSFVETRECVVDVKANSEDDARSGVITMIHNGQLLGTKKSEIKIISTERTFVQVDLFDHYDEFVLTLSLDPIDSAAQVIINCGLAYIQDPYKNKKYKQIFIFNNDHVHFES